MKLNKKALPFRILSAATLVNVLTFAAYAISSNQVTKTSFQCILFYVGLICVNTATLITWKANLKFNSTKPSFPSLSFNEVCPECDQPNRSHLATCSINRQKGYEAKIEGIKPRIPHCSHCGQKGHYAKKCPNYQMEEKTV